jgi:hypothetical protein
VEHPIVEASVPAFVPAFVRDVLVAGSRARPDTCGIDQLHMHSRSGRSGAAAELTRARHLIPRDRNVANSIVSIVPSWRFLSWRSASRPRPSQASRAIVSCRPVLARQIVA